MLAKGPNIPAFEFYSFYSFANSRVGGSSSDCMLVPGMAAGTWPLSKQSVEEAEVHLS